MGPEDHLSRRRFLETGSAALGAALTTGGALGASGKNEMKYRRFGKTNLMLSEIGLGCATGLKSRQLGPALFNQYREELPAILNRLLDRGGNFLATGLGYHDTEEILGKALHEGRRRKDCIIITAPDPPKDEVGVIIERCEQSLKNFHTDHIDCYFSHGRWSERFYEAALKLRQQGKIRFIGLSCHVPAQHRERIDAGQVDFIFQPYNYMALAKWTETFDRQNVADLFAHAKQKDVGVLVMKPMSGHFIPNWAKNMSDPKVVRLMGELKQLGQENLYQALLTWVLQNPHVSAAAVGLTKLNDVDEDCAAVGRRLTAAQDRLLELYATAATGDYCRMCETCMPSCPKGIPIPDILRFRMYYKNYGHRDDARELYGNLAPHRQAAACDGCGQCEQTCPNRLAIREKIQEAHGLLA